MIVVTQFTLPSVQVRYWEQLVGHIVIFTASLVRWLSLDTWTQVQHLFSKVVEAVMVVVSLRGSVMDDRPRESMQWLVYIKQGGKITGNIYILVGK